MISIIVPVWNVEPYIEEAVESLLSQTFSDFEIILVDDGSTDRSGRICDFYAGKDHRIRVIHQKNKGLSAARNAGLDVMHGEFCCFLDSDDAALPDMLSRMMAAMEKSGADIVECRFSSHKTSHRMHPAQIGRGFVSPSYGEGVYGKADALHMKIEGISATCVWNKLFRREMWENLRFPEGQNYEDLDIILPLLAQADHICFVNEILIMHRRRPDSITMCKRYSNVCDWITAYRHYVQYVRSHIPEYFDEADLRLVLTRRYMAVVTEFFSCACTACPDRKRNLKLLRRAVKAYEKQVHIRECGRKVQLACVLYSCFPPFLSGRIYQLYRAVKIRSLKYIQETNKTPAFCFVSQRRTHAAKR